MQKKIMLIIYSIVHFLVDLAGIYFLVGIAIPLVSKRTEWLFLALTYNFLAFALPMLMGFIADILRKNALFAAIGCMAVATGYLFWKTPLIAVLFIGTGNGMFHVGGGIDVLNGWKDKYAPSGIFISTGAMGVFLGNFFGSAFVGLWKELFGAMAASFVVLFLLFRVQKVKTDKIQISEKADKSPQLPNRTKSFLLAAGTLFIVVCIRSYYGGILNYPWKTGATMGLLFTVCIVFGKMAGGILADFVGCKAATVTSLGLAAVLSLFSFKLPICGFLSVFFFNMTMPLTLVLLARIFPKTKGLAFGILTFALFLGSLPVMLGGEQKLFSASGLFTMSLISLLLLMIGTQMVDKVRKKHDFMAD